MIDDKGIENSGIYKAFVSIAELKLSVYEVTHTLAILTALFVHVAYFLLH